MARICVLLVVLCVGFSAFAEEYSQNPLELVKQISFDQKLDAQVPLDVPFRDEHGRSVTLREYSGKRPLLLLQVYYGCPMLCTQVLNGTVQALKTLSLKPGTDFDVVAVSIDPKEDSALAFQKKTEYVRSYGKNTDAGWHFLTGDQTSIKALNESTGFRYVYNPITKQYAHAAGIVLLTPEGRVSRYFFGIEYSARDIRLGIVEASENKIGTLADQVLLYCYSYDPVTGKYGFAIIRTIQACGVLTVLALGTFIALNLRRDRDHAKAVHGEI